MATLTHFRLVGTGEWHLGLLMRRTYRWQRDGQTALAADQPEPTENEHTAWKPNTDVIVEGHAYAPLGGARSVVASIEVNGLRRQIRATGDRHITGVRGTWSGWSEPQPFERMPIEIERAYGGFDRRAFELDGDTLATMGAQLGADLEVISRFTYPRNAKGQGFYMALVGEGNLGRPVPNLDDPDDPVEPERLIRESPVDWLDAPTPAHWGWTIPTDFPRSLLLGIPTLHRPPNRPVREVEVGALTLSDLEAPPAPNPELGGLPSGLLFEPRLYQGGAPGMATQHLRGGETIRLRHLEIDAPDRVLRLPLEPPAARLRPPGCPWFDLEPQLDTLVLRPDARELAVTYSAKLRVAARYPGDELAAVESGVAWRSEGG